MTFEAGEAPEATRSHIIKRPRLTRLLDESTGRIILLVAPAGYGKTTLAREWLSTRQHAWYRGTSATADVAALALGLAKAASTIVPGVGERLATRLRVSDAPAEDVEALAELLAENLQAWPEDTWIAFDDYQFACDSAAAEAFVDHLASSSPVRLLISGRSRPNWATARRLLYGEIHEMGRNLLAMNQDEANSVLAGQVAQKKGGFIALADGWPALIGLAALADEFELPAVGIPDELYTYFAEELYQGVPADIQQALRYLALAPTLTPDITESLVGGAASHLIDQAARLGFFLGDSRSKLELHPLLRSFLASKFLHSQDDPDGKVVSGLVHALINQAEWDEAFDVIERFFDGHLLVELFDAALPRMVDESRLPTLMRWSATAASHRFDSPIIDFADAEVALKAGELRRAEVLAIQAIRHFPKEHPSRSSALWLAGTSAHLTSREDVALIHFDRAFREARSDADRRQALWGRFSASAKLDEVHDAEDILAELERRSGSSVDELLRIGTGQMMLAGLTGRLLQTLDSVDGLAPLGPKARDPFVYSSFLNVHAALLALGGRYDDARRSAELEIGVATTYGLAFAIPYAQFHLATSLWGLRESRRCNLMLSASEKAPLTANDAFLKRNIGVLRGRILLTHGSTEHALDVFDRYQHPRTNNSMEAEYFAWWSLAYACAKQPRQATDLATRAESISTRIEVAALVPWTRAVQAVNRRRSAQAAADSALQVALATGNIDAFVTAYRACPRLLALLVRNDANRDHLRLILERARDHRLARSVGLQLPAAPPPDGPGILTNREREVYELVTQGVTNREIGKALYISESTAKVHVRRILQKLGVRTRTEVAARALEFSD